MRPVTPFDWHRLFLGDEPPLFLLEIVFRVVVIYVFAVLLLRLMGKRGNRSLSPFGNVVLIALGSATGDSMFYPHVPLIYAAIVIAVVVALDRLIATAQFHSQRVNTFIEGNPLMMVKEGELLEGALHEARLRPDEFMGMLREQGVEDSGQVRLAFLERSGNLGFYRYDSGEAMTGESTFPVQLERRSTG